MAVGDRHVRPRHRQGHGLQRHHRLPLDPEVAGGEEPQDEASHGPPSGPLVAGRHLEDLGDVAKKGLVKP